MPGKASGPKGSEPIAQHGGLSFLIDGVPVGESRATINLLTSDGVAPRVVDDATPGSEKSDFGWDLSVVQLLAVSSGLDLVAGIGTTPLLAPAGARVVLIQSVIVIPESVDLAPVVQPEIEVTTPPASLAETFCANAPLACTDKIFTNLRVQMPTRMTVLSSVGPSNVLNLTQTVLATAANYRVTVLVYGYVLAP